MLREVCFPTELLSTAAARLREEMDVFHVFTNIRLREEFTANRTHELPLSISFRRPSHLEAANPVGMGKTRAK